MKHFLSENFTEINSILIRLFKLNQTRSSEPIKSQDEKQEHFEFACSIYKRGFISHSYEKNILFKNNFQIKNKTSFIDIINQIQINDPNVFFLVDENFIKKHPIFNKYTSYLPNESSKNLTTIKNILDIIPENTTSIFVLGGGITLDVGGFIAGLCHISVTYLATTLLSAVDAAIGGKTGVNFFPYGKNQVGLFYPHRTLYFVPEFLNTLSLEEKIGGVIEAVKQAYLFAECEYDIPLLNKIIINTITTEELEQIVQKNVYYKSYVVQKDLYEKKDIRSSLNFGHTLAHVLEALAEDKFIDSISHGVAVGHGLKFLMDFNFIEKKLNFYDFIQHCILGYPLVVKKEVSKEIIIPLLNQDKKKIHLNSCTLSLPNEGLFQFTSSTPESYDKVTKEFSLTDIAEKIASYIGSMKTCEKYDVMQKV